MRKKRELRDFNRERASIEGSHILYRKLHLPDHKDFEKASNTSPVMRDSQSRRENVRSMSKGRSSKHLQSAGKIVISPRSPTHGDDSPFSPPLNIVTPTHGAAGRQGLSIFRGSTSRHSVIDGTSPQHRRLQDSNPGHTNRLRHSMERPGGTNVVNDQQNSIFTNPLELTRKKSSNGSRQPSQKKDTALRHSQSRQSYPLHNQSMHSPIAGVVSGDRPFSPSNENSTIALAEVGSGLGVLRQKPGMLEEVHS